NHPRTRSATLATFQRGVEELSDKMAPKLYFCSARATKRIPNGRLRTTCIPVEWKRIRDERFIWEQVCQAISAFGGKAGVFMLDDRSELIRQNL
ncbi:MAG: hypothetical protein AAFN48_11660, partial [Pseudomonadota bacterium]